MPFVDNSPPVRPRSGYSVAHAMIFLMTNPYVTGHLLVVDGGLVAT
jgi:hypothetical protein